MHLYRDLCECVKLLTFDWFRVIKAEQGHRIRLNSFIIDMDIKRSGECKMSMEGSSAFVTIILYYYNHT